MATPPGMSRWTYHLAQGARDFTRPAMPSRSFQGLLRSLKTICTHMHMRLAVRRTGMKLLGSSSLPRSEQLALQTSYNETHRVLGIVQRLATAAQREDVIVTQAL